MGFNNNQSGPNSGGQYYMARILGYTVPTTADPDGGPVESVGGAVLEPTTSASGRVRSAGTTSRWS